MQKRSWRPRAPQMLLLGILAALVLLTRPQVTGHASATVAAAGITTVAATGDVPLPALTELPTTVTSHPCSAESPLPAGYVEQEFQMSGMAGIYSYRNPPPPPWTLSLGQMQPYTTRLLVRRLADPAKFNWTVVVEWLNVTAGFDLDVEWTGAGEYLRRAGYAWVGVSAQAAGVDALKKRRVVPES